MHSETTMISPREDVLKSAMALSEADRLLLATELLDTVAEDDAEWSLNDPALLDKRMTGEMASYGK